MDHIFLTVTGAVRGSFMATFGVASVFVDVVSRQGWGAIGDVSRSPRSFFFCINLDFSGGKFDL